MAVVFDDVDGVPAKLVHIASDDFAQVIASELLGLRHALPSFAQLWGQLEAGRSVKIEWRKAWERREMEAGYRPTPVIRYAEIVNWKLPFDG
jgi:hypothetical protein